MAWKIKEKWRYQPIDYQPLEILYDCHDLPSSNPEAREEFLKREIPLNLFVNKEYLMITRIRRGNDGALNLLEEAVIQAHQEKVLKLPFTKTNRNFTVGYN
ncbi:MAG: hypothetical protein ABIA37_00125 [Candidatus Woesearchaeota archaeon]